MKKQTTHPVQAHLLRGAVYLLLLLAVCAIPFALAQRNAAKQSMAKLGNALPANVILVTNTDDSGPGSLRDALAIANDGDTIDATGVSGTILLTSGELQISTPGVTIKGPGAETLAVNGNATFRVFENFAQDVTISGVTITNGVSGVGGGIHNVGGGVCCATLTVTNSTISGNSANQGGAFSTASF
jgi:hypothetical protein